MKFEDRETNRKKNISQMDFWRTCFVFILFLPINHITQWFHLLYFLNRFIAHFYLDYDSVQLKIYWTINFESLFQFHLKKLQWQQQDSNPQPLSL